MHDVQMSSQILRTAWNRLLLSGLSVKIKMAIIWNDFICFPQKLTQSALLSFCVKY